MEQFEQLELEKKKKIEQLDRFESLEKKEKLQQLESLEKIKKYEKSEKLERLDQLEKRLVGELDKIQPLDESVQKESQLRWDHIAKPLYSLGKLETAVTQIAGITRTSTPSIEKKALVILCADNGVVEEGVTQTGQEVTAIVAQNFLTGKTSVKLMADKTGTKIFPIDLGMVLDTSIINRKIAYGTKNFTKGPAMTRTQALQAILTGIDFVGELKQEGYQIICTGEMGIGNTTTSSALAALFLGEAVEVVTGKGAGLSDVGLQKKVNAIKKGIEVNQPNVKDPVDVLAKLGGFDLAGLTGVFLGGAIHQVPIVIDGFISSVAALTATRIHPVANEYAMASHSSKEPAGKMVLNALGKEAYITCDMCLGEGTGAVALMPILDLAFCVYDEMSTFGDIQVEEYKPL